MVNISLISVVTVIWLAAIISTWFIFVLVLLSNRYDKDPLRTAIEDLFKSANGWGTLAVGWAYTSIFGILVLIVEGYIR